MTYAYPFKDADEATKLAVWKKGKTINEGGTQYNPSIWRRDRCGHAMKYSDHGNTDSEYGWEIDHIVPRDKGGSDHIDNLQPLNWKMNRAKGNNHPWTCP